ncbi:MAG: TonB-dependent receptor [Crocinitomicaceae bacterium]|nr:TonB-dependent receptor [Crocinitomicaceae bacterium]
MKNLIMIVALFFTGGLFAQGALGEVMGTVLNKETGHPVYGAVAYIEDNGSVYRAITNPEGKFRISAVPAGEYLLNIKQYEDTMKNIPVNIPMDGFDQVGDIAFVSTVVTKDALIVSYDRNQLKMIDGNLPVATLTSEQIDKSPAKFDVKGLVSSMSSDVRQTHDGELVFRGARKGDMLYLVDGVKTSRIGAVPGVSIGRMMVYTGGLPAKYGDTLGGVVVMESKSYFDLYRKHRAQQIRDGK